MFSAAEIAAMKRQHHEGTKKLGRMRQQSVDVDGAMRRKFAGGSPSSAKRGMGVASSYAPCKHPGCRRPALMATGIQYCGEHQPGVSEKVKERATAGKVRRMGRSLFKSSKQIEVEERKKWKLDRKQRAKATTKRCQLDGNSGTGGNNYQTKMEFMRRRVRDQLRARGRSKDQIPG